MSSLTKALFLTTVLATFAGCAAQPREVPEIMPGYLQGYLAEAEQFDSRVFVPPAPEAGSPMEALDVAWSERMLALRGTPRWDLATKDAELHFPEAAGTFACALGVSVSETQTPMLYQLLRRTLTDLGLATYPAKNAYQRSRPFTVNGAPTCTPDMEERLSSDGSYPSGHTAIGWGWGLILAELAPEQAEALVARGRAFGESRNVCNVHWYSDVVAGRLVGAATVARLQDNPEFRKDLQAARGEIEKARTAGQLPEGDCDTEAAALAAPLF
ncbi:MAG: phosphatase PAP2 family protein [Pseudomonadales bacterium]